MPGMRPCAGGRSIKIRGIFTCGRGSVSRESLRPVTGRISLCGREIPHKGCVFTPEAAVALRKKMYYGAGTSRNTPARSRTGVSATVKRPVTGAYPFVRQGYFMLKRIQKKNIWLQGTGSTSPARLPGRSRIGLLQDLPSGWLRSGQ